MKSFVAYITRSVFTVVTAAVVGVLLVVGLVSAATTISTNISTGGNLTVTGTTDLTGLTTLVNATTTRVSISNYVSVGGMATTTGSTGNIATQGTFALGVTANAITDMTVGQCTVPTGTTIAASSTGMVSCTTDKTISTSDRVWVMATSSLAGNFIIQAASSTAATTIQVRLLNVGLTDGANTTAVGAQSLNYWAAR